MPCILLLALLFGCSGNTFTDERDGKEYKIVEIGKQVWMAENLQFEAEGSACYENKAENCEKYGRLYNWETAMKACPKGWHLPDNGEWDKLYRYADGTEGKESPYKSETSGKYLKAKSGWNDNEGESGNGKDKFGFAALPGGHGDSDGYFEAVGDYGNWWSASEYYANNAYSRHMYYYLEDAFCDDSSKDYYWFSVRCIKD